MCGATSEAESSCCSPELNECGSPFRGRVSVAFWVVPASGLASSLPASRARPPVGQEAIDDLNNFHGLREEEVSMHPVAVWELTASDLSFRPAPDRLVRAVSAILRGS